MTRLQASLILLFTGALWGFGFVAQANAMSVLGPHSVVALRFCLATLAVLPFALREGRIGARPLRRGDWLAFAATGFFLWLGSIAQQVGLNSTTVTNSGFLTGLYVVMVPLLGILAFRQWPHPVVWPAVLVAMFGIFLLSGGLHGMLSVGDWLTVLCAVCFAAQVVLIGRFAASTGRPVMFSVAQFGVCAVLGTVFALATEAPRLADVLSVLPELLYSGVVAGGVAFTLQAMAQAHVSAPAAAILLVSESVFAALFGAAFLGERLAPVGLVGCALILAAIVAVEAVPAVLARRRRVEVS